ncbi:MAG TPA: hypothetical protein DCX07_14735 [Phycisphaerales bacterium]|nr:hypothetical protein [Phycisphaerales bacterium]
MTPPLPRTKLLVVPLTECNAVVPVLLKTNPRTLRLLAFEVTVVAPLRPAWLKTAVSEAVGRAPVLQFPVVP